MNHISFPADNPGTQLWVRKIEIEREEAETEVIIRNRHGHRTDEDRTERSRGAELKCILSSCLMHPMSSFTHSGTNP